MTETVIRRLLSFDWFGRLEQEIHLDAAKFGFEVVNVTKDFPQNEVYDFELTLRGMPEHLDAFAAFYGDEDGPLEWEIN